MIVLCDQAYAVDPQRAANGAVGGNTLDANHDQSGFRSGNKAAIHVFPKIGTLEFLAGKQHCFAVCVLNGETGTAGTLDAIRLVIGRELIRGIGLDWNRLPNSGIGYAGPVE